MTCSSGARAIVAAAVIENAWRPVVADLGLGAIQTRIHEDQVMVLIRPRRMDHRWHFYSFDGETKSQDELPARINELVGRAWFDQPYGAVA
jgi:hypothetical protein